MRTWPFSTTTSPGSTPARSAPDGPTADYSKELNRILSAAVVSRRFRNLLLSDAAAALHSGYNGETFELSGPSTGNTPHAALKPHRVLLILHRLHGCPGATWFRRV